MEQEFYVPFGERNDLSDNEFPLSALRIAQNVFRSERGKLEIRPGYKITAGTQPGTRTMGLGYFRTAASAERYVAGTQIGAWQYNGVNWVNITGNALTGGTTDHVRFTTFPVSGTYKTLISNGVNTLKIWDGVAATYSDCGGSPGVVIDSAVVANRALLLQAPNTVKISDFNNPEVYPAGFGFTANLIDAGDLMVGIERLSRTSAAILGEESQWVAHAQSGQHPMRFERISEESGPVSSAVIVKLGSVVYYLADDYNVYRFDGVNCQPMGWAMKPWVEANISVANKKMSHGVYMDKVGKIFWFFPGRSSTGPNLGIHFDPKTGAMGRLQFSTYITASCRVRIVVTVVWDDLLIYPSWEDPAFLSTYPTWDSFGAPGTERRVALGDVTGNVHIGGTGDGSDNGSPIDCMFEVPLKTYGGWDKSQTPSTFETFFDKTHASTVVDLSLGYTDTLMGELEYKFIDSFDLATEQRNDIDITEIQEKRFITIRQRALANRGGVAWNGGLYRFESTDIATGPTSEE